MNNIKKYFKNYLKKYDEFVEKYKHLLSGSPGLDLTGQIWAPNLRAQSWILNCRPAALEY